MKKVILASAIIVMMFNLNSCSVDPISEELNTTEATVGENENGNEDPEG